MTDTKFPDELIEAVAKAAAKSHGFMLWENMGSDKRSHYLQATRTILTTAHSLGYATPVPWREAAAQWLSARATEADESNLPGLANGMRYSASQLRTELDQADPAPPAPVEPIYDDKTGKITNAPPTEKLSQAEIQRRMETLSAKLQEATTPPAEAVTRADIHTLGQVARCIQSVLCEMGGDSYVLWSVANEYLDDLGVGHAGETAKTETPNEERTVMPSEPGSHGETERPTTKPDVDVPASGEPWWETAQTWLQTHGHSYDATAECDKAALILRRRFGAVSAGGSSAMPTSTTGQGPTAPDGDAERCPDGPPTQAALEPGQLAYSGLHSPENLRYWHNLPDFQKAAWARAERAVAAKVRRETLLEAEKECRPFLSCKGARDHLLEMAAKGSGDG